MAKLARRRRLARGWSAAKGALALVTVALVGSCATVSRIDPKDESLSLIFGYLDNDEAPSGFDWAYLEQLDSEDPHGYTLPVDGGMFVHYGIRTGAYQLASFGGAGGIPLINRRDFVYQMAEGANPTAFLIEGPGAYYVGAFRYVEILDDLSKETFGLLGNPSFALVMSDQPDELVLLEKLHRRLQSTPDDRQYVHARTMVEKRLERIRRERERGRK